MRLLVVGKLNGQLSNAVKMAMTAGAKVSHVETIEAATHALRAGQGADLLLVDYDLDIAGLIAANGRGKSSLLRCLAGQLEPTAGDITRARGVTIGLVEQDAPAALLPLSLRPCLCRR